MSDPTTAFWQHQLTRGRRPTPRARERILRKLPEKMSGDERITVLTDPEVLATVLRETGHPGARK